MTNSKLLLFLSFLITFSFLSCECEKQHIDSVELLDGRFAHGYIIVSADKDHPTGVIRLYTNNHNSFSTLYKYDEKLDLPVNKDVFVKLTKQNGMTIASQIEIIKPENVIPLKEIRSMASSFSINLHNAGGHALNAFHRLGHILGQPQKVEIFNKQYFKVIFKETRTGIEKTLYFISLPEDLNGEYYIDSYPLINPNTRATHVIDNQEVNVVDQVSYIHRHFGDIQKVIPE